MRDIFGHMPQKLILKIIISSACLFFTQVAGLPYNISGRYLPGMRPAYGDITEVDILTAEVDVPSWSFRITYQTAIGLNYTVEASNDSAAWSPLGVNNVPGTGGILEALDPITQAQHFYRVLSTIQPNLSPSVTVAGSDTSVTLPNAANLTGQGSDDGSPNPPGVLSYQWTQQSGVGVATFADGVQKNTTATFSATGTYVLRLTVSDGLLTGFDDLTVIVSDGISDYQYDDLNRLINVTEEAGTITYQYDEVGNILDKTSF